MEIICIAICVLGIIEGVIAVASRLEVKELKKEIKQFEQLVIAYDDTLEMVTENYHCLMEDYDKLIEHKEEIKNILDFVTVLP